MLPGTVVLYSLFPLCAALAGPATPARIIVPLDGEWRIDESLAPDQMPATFGHTVRVPGLINQARPASPQPARKQVAILKISKAQFGVQVWLNGKKIGDNYQRGPMSTWR